MRYMSRNETIPDVWKIMISKTIKYQIYRQDHDF